MSDEEAKQCPWCERWALKTLLSCNYVVCGRHPDGFYRDAGCGKAWCYLCCGRLCGQMYDPENGNMLDPNEDHNHSPGTEAFNTCNAEGYCPGGHDCHKNEITTTLSSSSQKTSASASHSQLAAVVGGPGRTAAVPHSTEHEGEGEVAGVNVL